MVSRIFQLVADAEWQKMLPLCSETDRGRGRVPPCSLKADSRGYPECDQAVRPSSSTCVRGENEEQFLHHNSPSLKSVIKASWAGSATGTTALSCVRGGMLAVQRAVSHTLALMGRGTSPSHSPEVTRCCGMWGTPFPMFSCPADSECFVEMQVAALLLRMSSSLPIN